MSLVLHKDYITFNVLGDEVNIIYDPYSDQEFTFAEINERIYYLGNRPPTIESAIFAWEKVYETTLTADQITQIINNNPTKENTWLPKNQSKNQPHLRNPSRRRHQSESVINNTVKEENKMATKKPVKKPTTKPVKKPSSSSSSKRSASAPKKTVAKKPAAKKTVAKKPAAKKTVAKKTVAKKPVKKPAVKKPASSTKKTASKKTAVKKPTVKKSVSSVSPVVDSTGVVTVTSTLV